MPVSVFHCLLLVTGMLTGSASHATGNHPGTALRVNGFDISYQRFMGFYNEYQHSNGVPVGARGDQLPRLNRIREEALELLIEQELLMQAAESRGIQVGTADVDAALAEVSEPYEDEAAFARRLETEGYTLESYRAHLRRMLAAVRYLDSIRATADSISDAELETFYHDNEFRLTFPEQVRVRHILLAWKPLGQPDDRAALYGQMNAILAQARAGEDFAALARQYSDDSTAEQGGDVGFFRRGQMVAAFEEAAFKLQRNEISDIVETSYGLHILRLDDRKEPRLLPLDEVREPLREYLRGEKINRLLDAEKARLREAADIELLLPILKAEHK